jgi:hypothetical protein
MMVASWEMKSFTMSVLNVTRCTGALRRFKNQQLPVGSVNLHVKVASSTTTGKYFLCVDFPAFT